MSRPVPAQDRTWVTEIDPRLEPDRGPLQVLRSPKSQDRKGAS